MIQTIKNRLAFWTTTCCLLLIGCQQNSASDVADMPPGLSFADMDTTVSPKEDFYRFVNGGWLDRTEIPAKEGRWGGFPELREKNNQMMLDILTAAAKENRFEDGTDEKKAIDFYAIGMDSTLAEKMGTKPIVKWFEKIDALENTKQLQALVAEMHPYGYGVFFGLASFPNLKNSSINALYLDVDGIGLPNSDYYTKTDSESKALRAKYVKHISKMLKLAEVQGNTDAMASAVMGIENELANSMRSPVERRNIPALYNPRTLAQVDEAMSTIDMTNYFKSVGVDNEKVDTLIMTEPDYFSNLDQMISKLKMEDIKSYLKWHVINGASNFLNQEIVQANFEFYSKELQGTEAMRPRWERVLGTTNGLIGEALGKVYVAETFPPEAKESARKMIANLKTAFETRIQNLDWMTDETKEKAINKLRKMTVKIAYPDEWRDYGTLEVQNTGELYSFYGNVENARKWEFDENIREVGEPVDKSRWGMSPQTVNAYANPLNNEIVFPAAILQPPFYNYTADAAVNYGGIGAVIGHEISHCFDDQGSRFDAEGNLKNWWTEEDKQNFEARTARLVAQYDAYQVADSLNVQGKLTLGENIGDLGGVNAAYDALKIHLKENGNPGLIDGFTPEQRFFLSWATIWRTKYKDEALRTQVQTDPHSPGPFRAVGPLENLETFYAAFDLKEGDELWKPEAERVKIW